MRKRAREMREGARGRERESVHNYEELAHLITEAEKSHDLPFEAGDAEKWVLSFSLSPKAWELGELIV